MIHIHVCVLTVLYVKTHLSTIFWQVLTLNIRYYLTLTTKTTLGLSFMLSILQMWKQSLLEMKRLSPNHALSG